MDDILFGAILPHPPIIVPQIGGERIKQAAQTQQAMKEVARRLKALEKKLDAIVIVSPHGENSPATVPVYTGHVFEGNFGQFGAPKLSLQAKGLPEFAIALVKEGGLYASRSPETMLDHGFLVPLYYPLQEKIKTPIVPLAIGYLSLKELFEFGKKIKATAQKTGKKIAVIASADLSHHLDRERGREFDSKLVELVKKYDVAGIINFPADLADEAGQDALWSIAILLGALSENSVKTKVLSYEGPFGVGYMIAALENQI